MQPSAVDAQRTDLALKMRSHDVIRPMHRLTSQKMVAEP